MKTKPQNQKLETAYPIGFLQSVKKTWLFGSTKENPDKLFIVSNTKKSPESFSKTKEPIIIKNKLFKRNLHPEQMDFLVSAHAKGQDIITFLYGEKKNKKLLLASSKKDRIWTIDHSISSITERGGIVSDYLFKKEYHIAYYGESSIHLAASTHFKKWTKLKAPVLKARPGFFDHGKLKFIATKVCDRGILIFYDASVREGEQIKLQIGCSLFSASDPKKIIWRSDTPLFETTIPYEEDLSCKGGLFWDESVSFYWYSTLQGIFTVSLPLPFSKTLIRRPLNSVKRNEKNPIIAPEEKSWWKSQGTLNPAAVNIDGTIHLLFRAMGSDGISRIGYAKSRDGLHIDEISPEPVFALQYSKFGLRAVEKKFDPVMYPSGGSWGGCEDPRMVRIDNRLYMTFNAFDNWNNIRIGLISISVDDFLQKKWNWSKMKFISPKRRDKNWVLFPEKIHGKYAILHNLHSADGEHVMVEYVDDIDTLKPEDMDIESPDPQRTPNRKIGWHIRMRSIGPAPLKTKDGWLLLYHAHDAELDRYKVGAMLLDLDDPTKIIARSAVPILTPDTWYENNWKPGIVYASGTVVKDDVLFVYYGGGDRHVCVATIPLPEFIENLRKSIHTMPKITKIII